MIYQLEDLLSAHTTQTFDYLLFWGHRQSKTINKGCFSQWYPAPFTVDGRQYPTAEHYMMVQKALLFDNTQLVDDMLSSTDPKQVKALGRKVQHFDETLWRQHRFEIVVQGNLAKFSQHPALGDFLRKTADKVLVEASPVDKIWGIGLKEADPRAQDPTQWQGLNLLGFALMKVRHILYSER